MLAMKNFDIQKLYNFEYNFIIYSTTFESPLTQLNEINAALKLNNINKNTRVLIDLLLSIGNTSERFVEATFDGEMLSRSSFKFVNIPKKHRLRRKACDYFKQNLFLLDNSVLNSSQKNLLSKGITI